MTRLPLRLSLLTASLFLGLAASAVYAADGGETTVMADGAIVDNATGQKTGEGGQCNWDGFKQSLKNTESCGGEAQIVNCLGYAGYYQFGEGALATIGWYQEGGSTKVDGDNKFEGSWTGKAFGLGTATPTTKKCGSCKNPTGSGELVSPALQAFLNSPQAQEQAFVEWMDYMHKATRPCHDKIGKTVTGYKLENGVRKEKTCQVTLSGILAGGHIGGAGGVCNTLNSGKDVDDSGGGKWGTSRLHYVCTHGGFDTPYDQGSTASQSCGQTTPGGGGGGGPGPGSLSGADEGERTNAPTAHYELINNMVERLWLGGLMLMTEQFTATMMYQAQIIGSFFDAKHQLETQRLFQKLTAQAHKDYHPSEQMCTIGTFTRSLANTQKRGRLTQSVLSQRSIQRDMMTADAISSRGPFIDQLSRYDTFIKKFCDPRDNAEGLADICTAKVEAKMMNADIDFTRTLDLPLSLDINPLRKSEQQGQKSENDKKEDSEASDDELAVFALLDHIFTGKSAPSIPKEHTTRANFIDLYQEWRSLSSMRFVGRNSFNHYVAQKAYGPEADKEETGSNAAYMRALIREMGITNEEEITAILGERPSYWAQMEVLTKKIYQHPNFVVNLYDKPANVARMNAAMLAIKSMQDRDIAQALARREMLMAMLTELAIRKEQARVTNLIRRLNILAPSEQ